MLLQSLIYYFMMRRFRRQKRIPVVIHPERITVITSGPLIIVSNHVRAMDPFYIGAIVPFSLFPIHFLIARWFRTPLLQFFAVVGIIPILARIGALVTISKGAGIEKNIRDAVKKLRAGGTVGVFPEGHRNNTVAVLQSLKHGAAAMAYHSNAPILPLFITFPDPAIERATITVGELFYIKTNDYEQGTAHIRERLLALASE